MNLTKNLVEECKVTIKKLETLSNEESEILGAYCTLSSIIKGLRSLNETIENRIIKERR